MKQFFKLFSPNRNFYSIFCSSNKDYIKIQRSNHILIPQQSFFSLQTQFPVENPREALTLKCFLERKYLIKWYNEWQLQSPYYNCFVFPPLLFTCTSVINNNMFCWFEKLKWNFSIFLDYHFSLLLLSSLLEFDCHRKRLWRAILLYRNAMHMLFIKNILIT